MRNSDGSPVFATNGTRLISKPDPFLQTFMNGPVFGLSNYSSSPTATQITDAVQRAEFHNVEAPNWHTMLAPSVKTARTMVLASGLFLRAQQRRHLLSFGAGQRPGFHRQAVPAFHAG
jgi:hypothetical protein